MSRISKEAQARFFEDLANALKIWPELTLAIKPKRDAERHGLVLSDAYRELLDPNGLWRASGRVLVFPTNIDPYLPIAIADGCIGMPFTSPIAAALYFRRSAAWYDPIDYCDKVCPPEVTRVLLKGETALRQRIIEWTNGVFDQDVPTSLAGSSDDPIETFAAIIAQPFPSHCKDSLSAAV
jgi:polysaccharide biosynthesis PFTS motif protein